MKKLNIAIIHPALDIYGGAERQVIMLAQNLIKDGHLVKIYVSKLVQENCFPEEIEKIKENIVVVGGPGWSDRAWLVSLLSPIFMFKLASKIDRKHEIINAHNPPSNLAVYFYKKFFAGKGRTVWMLNEPASWRSVPKIAQKGLNRFLFDFIKIFYNHLDKISAKCFDEIVVLDYKNKDKIKNLYGKEAKVIRTGLDYKKADLKTVNSLISRHNLKNKKLILTVNRLEKQKRVEDFIRSIGILVKQNPSFKSEVLGVVVGKGSEESFLKKITEKLNLSNTILFIGSATDKELIAWYKLCDIFVFTPVNQTWGLTPLEAMSFGKPTIISDGAGVVEVLKDKKNSIIVPVMNPKKTAESLKKLIVDDEFYKDISKNGEKYVRDNLSWEKYSKDMVEFF